MNSTNSNNRSSRTLRVSVFTGVCVVVAAAVVAVSVAGTRDSNNDAAGDPAPTTSRPVTRPTIDRRSESSAPRLNLAEIAKAKKDAAGPTATETGRRERVAAVGSGSGFRPYYATPFNNCNRNSDSVFSYSELGGVDMVCNFPDISYLKTLVNYPWAYRHTYGFGYLNGVPVDRLNVDSEWTSTDCRYMCGQGYGITYWNSMYGGHSDPTGVTTSASVNKQYDWMYLISELYVYAPNARYICKDAAWYRGTGQVYSQTQESCRVG